MKNYYLILCAISFTLAHLQGEGEPVSYANEMLKTDEETERKVQKGIDAMNDRIKDIEAQSIWQQMKGYELRKYDVIKETKNNRHERPSYWRDIDPENPSSLIHQLENEITELEKGRLIILTDPRFAPAPKEYQEKWLATEAALWQRISNSGLRTYTNRLIAKNLTPLIKKQEGLLRKLIQGKNARQLIKNGKKIEATMATLNQNKEYRHLRKVLPDLEDTEFLTSYKNIEQLLAQYEELNALGQAMKIY